MIALLRTTACTTAARVKPRISDQAICQVMVPATSRAWPTASRAPTTPSYRPGSRVRVVGPSDQDRTKRAMASAASFTFWSASWPPAATAAATQWARCSSRRLRATDCRALVAADTWSQDVDAVLVFLDHALQSPDLTFDPAQPLQVIVFVGAVPVHHSPFAVCHQMRTQYRGRVDVVNRDAGAARPGVAESDRISGPRRAT